MDNLFRVVTASKLVRVYVERCKCRELAHSIHRHARKKAHERSVIWELERLPNIYEKRMDINYAHSVIRHQLPYSIENV